MELIYCAGGNARFAEIALLYGFRYGAQIPNYKIYADLWFADQDWKRPDRAAYMAALAQHKPTMATVLDLERPEQLSEVLEWAEEAAAYCRQVLIIPKYSVRRHRGTGLGVLRLAGAFARRLSASPDGYCTVSERCQHGWQYE